jgi:hypothetical protein
MKSVYALWPVGKPTLVEPLGQVRHSSLLTVVHTIVPRDPLITVAKLSRAGVCVTEVDVLV